MRILKFKNSEKGIAIIFALGIISMLFVIALGFVTTSIVEKQTGENFNELEVARLVAQSGLQRVIAAMTIYSEDTTKNFADVFSKNEEIVSDDIKRENLGGSDGLLQTEINDVVYYSAPTGSYNVDSFPTWQYLPFNHSTDTPIIARFAYLVLENKGKIDPSASVDSGVNASNNSVPAITEKFAVTEETSVDSDGDNVIGRPGRNMNELFLKAFPSNWKKFSSPSCPVLETVFAK